MNIPIIGAKPEEPKFPAKNIQITPNGDVVVQIMLAPDIITSTIVLNRDEMAQIDALRKQVLIQQRQELQIVKAVMEKRNE